MPSIERTDKKHVYAKVRLSWISPVVSMAQQMMELLTPVTDGPGSKARCVGFVVVSQCRTVLSHSPFHLHALQVHRVDKRPRERSSTTNRR